MLTEQERRARIKYNRYMRETGGPTSMITDAEHDIVCERLKVLHFECGMSWEYLGKKIGRVHGNGLSRHVSGDYTGMRRTVFNKIMAVEVTPVRNPSEVTGRGKTGRSTGAYIDAIGAARRLRALNAQGFDSVLLDVCMNASKGTCGRMARGMRTVITYDMHRRVAEMFQKLDGCDPLDFGASEKNKHRTILIGKNRGYATSVCWDEDTIDDPDAHPEWTGACGTVTGFEIHHRDGIPVCEPCDKARSADRVAHVLTDLDTEARTAYCEACSGQVDVVIHGSSCNRGKVRYRCGPHIRGLRVARIARRKHFQEAIDRLTDEGRSTAEIAAELGVVPRTVTRRRAMRENG